jgi:large subunit ribosomal protein L20
MRVKRGFKARRRRNKVLKLARGYRAGRSKLFRTAADALDKALMYAYRDRRVRKRKFMHGLKLSSVQLDRKVLADLAVSDPAGFSKIAGLAAEQL